MKIIILFVTLSINILFAKELSVFEIQLQELASRVYLDGEDVLSDYILENALRYIVGITQLRKQDMRRFVMRFMRDIIIFRKIMPEFQIEYFTHQLSKIIAYDLASIENREINLLISLKYYLSLYYRVYTNSPMQNHLKSEDSINMEPIVLNLQRIIADKLAENEYSRNLQNLLDVVFAQGVCPVYMQTLIAPELRFIYPEFYPHDISEKKLVTQ